MIANGVKCKQINSFLSHSIVVGIKADSLNTVKAQKTKLTLTQPTILLTVVSHLVLVASGIRFYFGPQVATSHSTSFV